MEPTTKTDLKVGIFMTIGLFLLCLSILMLGGDKIFFKRYYTLKVELSQVQGLAAGSIVSLAGLNIGNVTKIQMLPEKNKLEVSMSIDRSFQDRIRKGSSAELRTQGALGDKYIYIIPSDLNNEPLKNGDFLVANDGPDFISLITSKGNALDEVFDIIHELDVLMKNVNGDNRSGRIMENLSNTSNSLNQAVGKLNNLLADVDSKRNGESDLKRSFRHLASILQKVDSGEGTLGALVNDPTLHDSLKQFLGGAGPRHRIIKSLVRDAIQTNEGKQ